MSRKLLAKDGTIASRLSLRFRLLPESQGQTIRIRRRNSRSVFRCNQANVQTREHHSGLPHRYFPYKTFPTLDRRLLPQTITTGTRRNPCLRSNNKVVWQGVTHRQIKGQDSKSTCKISLHDKTLPRWRLGMTRTRLGRAVLHRGPDRKCCRTSRAGVRHLYLHGTGKIPSPWITKLYWQSMKSSVCRYS